MAKLQHRIGKKVLRSSVEYCKNKWTLLTNHTDYEQNWVKVTLVNGFNKFKVVEFPVLDVGG